jgi:hypothetical protein
LVVAPRQGAVFSRGDAVALRAMFPGAGGSVQPSGRVTCELLAAGTSEPKAVAVSQQPDGTFEAVVVLSRPGVHRFAFLVEGTRVAHSFIQARRGF